MHTPRSHLPVAPPSSRLSFARVCALFLALALALGVDATARTDADINFDWRFQLNGNDEGTHAPTLDDRAWRVLRMPHDWSAELPFDESLSNGATAFVRAASVGTGRHSPCPSRTPAG